jgi:hypothetical protein
MDTLSSVNKKLLARICQESSDPVNGAGTVMANSIAALDSSDLNRFGKWQTGDCLLRPWQPRNMSAKL